MNTNIKSLVVACSALMSIACVKTEVEELPVKTSKGVEITITAVREGFNPDTKTVRKSDGSVEWCPLDEISVFYTETANGGSKFTSQNTEQAAIAEFKGQLDGFITGGEEFTEGKYLYGVYPYSTNTSFKDGVTTISLPSHQTAAEGTFANGLFPTIARAQSVNLAFYNICGGVKFTVSRDDITSISFKGNNGERLAGSAKVIFDDRARPAVLDEEVESKDEITVYAPAGGTFKAGKEYFIVAYPAKLTSGFTMTFQTSAMKEGKYVSKSSVEIRRSVFGVLKQVDKNVTSWTDSTNGGGGESSGIYLGIMGFNQQLYSYPIKQLTNVSKPGFGSFIDDLNMKNGTLLYYSVDQAINTLQSVPLPADLSTAAIVTFTDGLDQGSMMMGVPYSDNTEYLDALNSRIMNETVNRQPITAYSVGIRGQDVADEAMFTNNLKKLSSENRKDGNQYAYEVTSMSEVNAKFKEIAEQLSKSSYIQTINLTIPGLSNGTKVRFTFDNVSSAGRSNLYIEGTFNLADRSLENVKYVGLTSTSGTTVKGVVDGIFVTFTFEGVHTNNNVLIDNTFTDEWTYITSNNTWQINSEFDKTEDSDIITERYSAVIMLVLDCSSSLANDFTTAQNNAKDFINTLYEAVGGDSGTGENPGDNDDTIYATTPTDLSVAIWQDGTRYYLTPEQYKNANLSNATVEGLTVVSNMGNFIISPNHIQSDDIYLQYAMEHYSGILPDKDQATVISARYIDINNTLSSLGWSGFITSDYLTKTSYDNDSRYNYSICLGWYTGGELGYTSSGYIRGVLPITVNGPILWNDERDLCLSVVKNGEKIFLKNATEDLSQYDKIEGLAVVLGDNKFIIKLSNEQSGKINISSAMALYSDILPDKKQAEIISMKYSDINSALQKFGGNPFTVDDYLTKTSYNNDSRYNYSICLGWYTGGELGRTSSGYIRGVVSFEYTNPDTDITADFDPLFAQELQKRGYIADAKNITPEEVKGITKLDVSEGQMLGEHGYEGEGKLTSLRGIEYFESLTHLNCHGNHLTTLDVSKNTALTYLNCGINQLTTLDVSKHTALTDLNCGYNQLTALDVSKNTALTYLECRCNHSLTTLDVSKNTALTGLDCYSNQLTALDVSKNTALTYLNCDVNRLTTLDVSKNTALTELHCAGNRLTTLDVSKNTALTYLKCFDNRLTTLDVSKNTALTDLSCGFNQLTTLDVSKNTALTELECRGNQLTTLDVSKPTALIGLWCDGNRLTTLDVSKNTVLTKLYCYENQLTTLDVSMNTALTILSCFNNQLTTLDVSNNTALTELDCKKNPGDGSVFPVTAWFDNNSIPNSEKFTTGSWSYNGNTVRIDYRKAE